jgi:hypothetical protein
VHNVLPTCDRSWIGGTCGTSVASTLIRPRNGGIKSGFDADWDGDADEQKEAVLEYLHQDVFGLPR